MHNSCINSSPRKWINLFNVQGGNTKIVYKIIPKYLRKVVIKILFADMNKVKVFVL